MFLLFLLSITKGCKEDGATEPDFDNFDEAFEYLVEEYVRMGAAIGILDKNQDISEFYVGSLSQTRERAPNGHSLFEIGSITKTFTATLLAKMVLEGKTSLAEEISSLLPDGEVTVPQWNGTRINLQHLATHSSGLPKRPLDSRQPLPPGFDNQDPYAAYTTEYLYDYLTSYCQLLFEPGTRYSYSNTGMGLVGHALGLVDQSSYEALLHSEVLDALGMEETTLFLGEHQLSDLAPGHDEGPDSVKNYHAQDVFQGAGFLKSSLKDMLVYLQAQVGLLETPLADAIEMTHQPLFDVGTVTYNDREGIYQLEIGLSWHIDHLPDGAVFYSHGGRTNGYMAYMGFDPQNRTGVVVLCNQSQKGVITRFGEDLLKAVNKFTAP